MEIFYAWNNRSFCATALLVCAVLLGGCTKSEEEQQADIEMAHLLIDSRHGGVPKDFPKDAPVYPGVTGILATNEEGNRTLMASSKDGVDKVSAYYEQELKKNGWTQAGPSSSGDGLTATSYTKETRDLSVCIGQDSWKLTCIILSLVDKKALAAVPKEVTKPEDPEACAILTRMAQMYASCGAYRDKGVVETKFIEKDGTRTTEEPFSTAFIRPKQFRFEYQDRFSGSSRWYRHIVHSDEAGTRVWDDPSASGTTSVDSLHLALAGFKGVSSDASYTVPSMLFGGLMDDLVTVADLTEMALLPEATLNGVPCHKISGKYGGGEVVSLWIDKSSLLLRRIDEARGFSDFRTETTTTYEPEVNGTVTPEDLEFNPPTPASVAVADAWEHVTRADASVLLVVGSGACLFVAGCASVIKRMRRRCTRHSV